VVVSLSINNDLNQRSYFGKYRVSEFEAQLINIIYTMSTIYQLNAVKNCMYEIIADTERLNKMMSWCSEAVREKESIFVKKYGEWLLPPMRLFYFAYQKYNYEKDKDFAEQIIETVKLVLDEESDKGIQSDVARALVSIIFENGKMQTLPTPNAKDNIRYADILCPAENKSLYEVMKKVNPKIRCKTWIELSQESTCHLDPNIDYRSIKSEKGWRGCFGQGAAAQSVLKNNMVGEGDIFISLDGLINAMPTIMAF